MDFSNGRHFRLDCDASYALFREADRANNAAICKPSGIFLWVRHSEYMLAGPVSLCCKGSCAISANHDPLVFRQGQRAGRADVAVSAGADFEPMDYDDDYGWCFCHSFLDLVLGNRSGNFGQVNGKPGVVTHCLASCRREGAGRCVGEPHDLFFVMRV